jgi:glutathione S-transferase
MKVEVYLKLMHIPYGKVTDKSRRAPKRKLPYIVDDGSRVPDSGHILAHLEKKQKVPLDDGLSEAAKARGHVMKRTLEESLYFVVQWSRWAEDSSWELWRRRLIDPLLPAPLRLFVPAIVRRKAIAQSVAQGIGRHTREEIYAWGIEDVSAVATLIGDGPFALGDRIRTVDMSIYAFLATTAKEPIDTPLRAFVRGHAGIMRYIDRVAAAVPKAKAA